MPAIGHAQSSAQRWHITAARSPLRQAVVERGFDEKCGERRGHGCGSLLSQSHVVVAFLQRNFFNRRSATKVARGHNHLSYAEIMS
jgi:hypothetical protein